MELYLGHRAKIAPPVLINRNYNPLADDDLEDQSKTSANRVHERSRSTTGVEGEDDPYLTGVRHRSAKKKRKSLGPDQAQLLQEFVIKPMLNARRWKMQARLATS